MFGGAKIEKAFDVSVATSSQMEQAMLLWSEMYEDRPSWKKPEDLQLTMNLPAAIASEIARLVTLEMKSTIAGSPRADFLNEQYQRVVDKAREFTEYACASGGVILKPYLSSDDKIMVAVVQAVDFHPVSFDSDGDVTAGIFTDYAFIGKKKYTRLEFHQYENRTITITNKVFCLETSEITNGQKDALGNEVPLTEVPEWEKLAPVVTIKDVDRVLFSYFKMPFANHVDPRSPLGVSTFSRATEQIQRADALWSEIAWEFKAGETAVHASDTLFKKDENGNVTLPEGTDRLFRTFAFDKDQKLDTFAPDFRDTSLFNGLNQTLHKIEFLCGLAYGTISVPTQIDKTATEVKQSRQRSFSTVSDIQKSLEKALRNLIYSIDAMTSLYNLAPEGEYEVSFDWDDSLIVDREVEFGRLMSMVAADMIRPEYVVAWYFGVPEEEALEMAPSNNREPPDKELPLVEEE